jgi:hypothetical protein
MNEVEAQLWAEVKRIADEFYDGHFTVFKFTTEWRVGFGTPLVGGSGVDWRLAGHGCGRSFFSAARDAIINSGKCGLSD